LNSNDIDLKHFAMVFEVTANDLENVMKADGKERERLIQNLVPSIIKLCRGRGAELRELDKLHTKQSQPNVK